MKPTSVAAVIVFLLLTVATTCAQTPTASAQTCPTGEEPYNPKLGSFKKGDRNFNIYATYCLKGITAGRSGWVTVSIETVLIPGAPLLEIKGIPTMLRAEDAGRITFSKADPTPDDKPPLSFRHYSYPVQISDSAEPRKYMVHLNLGFPDGNQDKELINLDFELPVGVNSNGKLEIAKDPPPDSFQAALFFPVKHTCKLKLRNLFRDYNAYVESISVDSEPSGWIKPFTMTPAKDEQWNIAPSGEKTFKVEFDTTPFSANLIRGFGGTPPRLKFDILYNDGFRRQLTYDEGQHSMTVSPSGWVLLIAVLLGLAFGAVVRGLLEFMVFQKQLTRKAVGRIVTSSVVFGLVVVLLSVLGQIELKSKTLSVSSSYDNPLGMLGIGLVSALTGLQLLTGWLNAVKSGE